MSVKPPEMWDSGLRRNDCDSQIWSDPKKWENISPHFHIPVVLSDFTETLGTLLICASWLEEIWVYLILLIFWDFPWKITQENLIKPTF